MTRRMSGKQHQHTSQFPLDVCIQDFREVEGFESLEDDDERRRVDEHEDQGHEMRG